jgi:hypothetical protein
MSYVSLSDTDIMRASRQVRVHFSQSCPVGAHSDYSEFSNVIAAAGGNDGGQSISSVASVTGDTGATLGNIFAIQTNYYIVTVNPVDGAQVGQLRADIMNALQVLAQSKTIPCSNFTVDIIEYDNGQSIFGGSPSAPGLSTTLVVLGIAIIAVVFLALTKEV